MNPTVAAMLAVVSTPPTPDGGGQGADFGKSSPLGLLILILFLVAVAFLVRSMSKHLKRVPASFDHDDTADSAESAQPDASTDPAPPTSSPESTSDDPPERAGRS